MRVLLVSPAAPDSLGGNAATVARLAQGLRARGHEVEILEASGPHAEGALAEAARRATPDVVHLYHAWRSGRLAKGLPSGLPIVIGIGGTDVNRDLDDPDHAREVEDALRRARAILAPTEDARDRILRHLPERAAAVRVVSKGVSLPDLPFPFRETYGFQAADLIFFMPAAVRRMKGNLLAARAMRRVRQREPRARALFAGPALEPDYAADFRSALEERDVWIEAIPRGRMAGAYRGSDVVLNASSQEGLSNALLEAMWLGRAVLASAIPANRTLIRDGETGLLFEDEEGLVAAALRLAEDSSLRGSLGLRAAAYARARHDPAIEIEGTLAAYADAIRRARTRRPRREAGPQTSDREAAIGSRSSPPKG